MTKYISVPKRIEAVQWDGLPTTKAAIDRLYGYELFLEGSVLEVAFDVQYINLYDWVFVYEKRPEKVHIANDLWFKDNFNEL